MLQDAHWRMKFLFGCLFHIPISFNNDLTAATCLARLITIANFYDSLPIILRGIFNHISLTVNVLYPGSMKGTLASCCTSLSR